MNENEKETMQVVQPKEIDLENQENCCCKHKHREADEYKDLIHRLNRIEGQIRGIRGMVERDVYCTDILIQVSAVNAALNSFNKVLLENHIKTCEKTADRFSALSA